MKRKAKNSPNAVTKKVKDVEKRKFKGKKKKKKSNRLLKSDDYYIVPWYDRSEWEVVCENFNDGNYEEVISTVTMWRERVPALPVGVETTLALLHALVADGGTQVSEDQCRSLYSLAVIRFLNHISHVATVETGENLSMSRLATHLNVPDWIVDLRHEISHGPHLPTLDTLRYAADFMKSWLKENYWMEAGGGGKGSSILRNHSGPPKEETYDQISCAVSSFIACRVYKLRGVKRITDTEITHRMPGQPWSVTPKQAMGVLKTRMANFFTRTPSLVCHAIANEMIPTTEFLAGFSAITENENLEDVFAKIQSLFEPLIELMVRRSKIPQLCTLMASIHVDEATKGGKLLSAFWLDLLLSKLEEGEKTYPLRLKKILALVMNGLHPSSNRFLPRLLRLLESKMGAEKISHLVTLINISTDDSMYENVKSRRLSSTFVTLEEITHQKELPTDRLIDTLEVDGSRSELGQKWQFDHRGQNFWRQQPLGSVP